MATAGSVTFEGHDLFAKMNRQQNMDLTQKIQIIYQDPYSSLDPRFTVGRCIEEPLIVHHMGNKEERRARVLQLMHDVGLNLMRELQRKYQLTYIFISHNLSVVKHICDRIAVMYLGNIVEIAPKKELFDNPLHPYTKALLGAIPIPDPDIPAMQDMLEGDVPSPINPPKGCCFHTRCHGCCKECTAQKPKLINVGNDHWVACCKV